MSSLSAIDISASGLFAQRAKLDAIASNIANVSTTRTAAGGPYKKQEVILRASSRDSSRGEGGVEVDQVVESSEPPKMVFDPSNPDADASGMVAMPNINIMDEMVDMITATRAYEANVQAVNASRTMASKALEIGRG